MVEERDWTREQALRWRRERDELREALADLVERPIVGRHPIEIEAERSQRIGRAAALLARDYA